MRRMKHWAILAIVLLLAASSAGCERDRPSSALPEDAPAIADDQPVTLQLWSHFGGWEWLAADFHAQYPNVTIEVTTFSYDDYRDRYVQAMLDGTPPDIVVIDSEHFGMFTNIDALEDLLQPPYLAGAYEAEFSPAIWRSSFSVDGRRLIGLPYTTAPALTFYRADIMEDYGYPSEPEALATYMEDPRNWLNMARDLSRDDKWIVQWSNEILRLYELSQSMYDEHYEFQRNNPSFVRALDLAKTVNDEGLDSNLDVWTEVGAQAVRDGRIPMLYLGTWGADQIRAWAPETEGRWRATRLPFGLNGWSNSSIFALPKGGANKEWAWKAIQYAAIDKSVLHGTGETVPAYLPARDDANRPDIRNGFLGGQSTYKLYRELMEETEEHILTPIDEEASAIWDRIVVDGIEQRTDSQHILDMAEAEIEKQLGKDLAILRSLN